MNKSERKKLAVKITRAIEQILSQVEKKTNPKTHKKVVSASRRLVKKISGNLKKGTTGKKQNIKRNPSQKSKARKTGK